MAREVRLPDRTSRDEGANRLVPFDLCPPYLSVQATGPDPRAVPQLSKFQVALPCDSHLIEDRSFGARCPEQI